MCGFFIVFKEVLECIFKNVYLMDVFCMGCLMLGNFEMEMSFD